MALEASSRTGGTWFSVMMWLGIAGEFGTCAASWTSRSKIWLPAGDASLGDEDSPRPGEEGVWIGEVVDCRVGGFLVCLLVSLAALAAGSDLDGVLTDSSVFFFPSPNSPRILFFFSGSLAPPTAAPILAPVRTFSGFCDFGSNGSASAGEGWFDEPLCSGAELARLIVDAGGEVQNAVFVVQKRRIPLRGGIRENGRRGKVSQSQAGELEACGMPDLREICRKQSIYVNKQGLLRAGRVVSQWRLLIGTERESGEISEGKQSKQAGGERECDVGRRLSPKSTCGGV